MAWTTPSAWTAVTISIDGLANAASATATTTITNGTAKDLFVDLSVRLALIAPGSAGPCLELHLLPLLDDGVTYADIVRATDVVPVTPTTSGKSIGSTGLRIAPGSHRIAIVNQTGVSLGTGNTVAYRTYSPG